MTHIGLSVRKSAVRGAWKRSLAFAAAACFAALTVEPACGGNDVCDEYKSYYDGLGCTPGWTAFMLKVGVRLPSEADCHTDLQSACRASCMVDLRVTSCLELMKQLPAQSLDPNSSPSALQQCFFDCHRTDGGFAR
jgi:hypothetical protein